MQVCLISDKGQILDFYLILFSGLGSRILVKIQLFLRSGEGILVAVGVGVTEGVGLNVGVGVSLGVGVEV